MPRHFQFHRVCAAHLAHPEYTPLVNTTSPSMFDTFNWFSQKRKLPSNYAYLFEYDIHFLANKLKTIS